jgi:uncharacterized protein YceH (UPF0502 family)
LRVPSQSVALLTVLMLRGPQTAGELRIACDRMHNFADISSVEAFLEELAERPAGALVQKLSRQPGAREQRWAQLLGGPPAPDAAEPPLPHQFGAVEPVSLGELATLKTRVASLEQQLKDTRTLLTRVCSELGMPNDLWPEDKDG